MPDTTVPTLRARDMLTVDDLFIKDGYVLDFSNPRYATFFREEVGIEIDDPKWSAEGASKGKRLRYFLRTIEPHLAAKALKALWAHRQIQIGRSGTQETVANAKERFDELLVRLGDKPDSVTKSPSSDKPAIRPNYDLIHQALISLTNRPPQERGFAFEKFLQKMFNAFGLEAEKPFRLTGEQIDGSFHFEGATYLLEAKWQNDRTGAGDLHAFHGKVDLRAAWARGLFVSYSGFTEEGLVAFGRARKVSVTERYGFKIVFIDDNSVHVRDSFAREVAFEFPMANIGLDEYDQFIRQMGDSAEPLPSRERLRLAITKPVADPLRAHTQATSNAATYSYSWEQHANQHGMSADEIKSMYDFAREQLFSRFKARLRDDKR